MGPVSHVYPGKFDSVGLGLFRDRALSEVEDAVYYEQWLEPSRCTLEEYKVTRDSENVTADDVEEGSGATDVEAVAVAGFETGLY